MKICPNCSGEIQDTFNFCPICGNDLGRPIICSKCNYPNEPNSKFCQECGEPLFSKLKAQPQQKKEKVNVEIIIPEPPKVGITIEFPYSTAQSFDFAIREAKKFETFEQYGEDKKALYRINVFEDELYRTKDLLEHLKGWRKRTVYCNGEKAVWDDIFRFFWCYESKLTSYKPEYYCFGYENEYEFNIWGCLMAGMSFNEDSKWFTYGKWVNDTGDWEFNKERIKHELAKELHNYRYCPAINLTLIQEVLEALPRVVNPAKNKNWKFMETYGEDGTNTLMHKINEDGYERIVYYNGVCPKGKLFLKDISDNIRKKLPDFINA